MSKVADVPDKKATPLPAIGDEDKGKNNKSQNDSSEKERSSDSDEDSEERTRREEQEKLILFGEEKEDERDLPGPGKNQQCTDVLCLLFFFIFCIGWIMLGMTAFQTGDPNVLTQGRDMYGGLCGVKNTIPPHDLTDRPYLLFPTPTQTNLSFCVEKCPTVLQDVIDLTKFDATAAACPYYPGEDGWVYPTADISFFPPSSNVFPWHTSTAQCYFGYASMPIFGRCIISVENLEQLNTTVFGNVNEIKAVRDAFADASDMAEKLLSDLTRTKFLILGAAFGALVLAFVWLIILTYLAKVFVYTSIFLVWLCFAAFAFLFAYIYYTQAGYDRLDPDRFGVDAQKWSYVTLALAITAGLCLLIYTCLVAWVWGSLKLAIAIIQEAAEALQYVWSLIFLPMFTFVALALLYVWFMFCWVFLYTSGENVVKASGEFDQYEPDKVLQAFQYYNLFGFFWANAFIIGATQMTCAGAIGLWYYRPKKVGSDGERTSELEKHLWLPMVQSLKNTLLYHLGTVAFGALTIAICQMLTYFIAKLQKQVGAESALGRLLCVLMCYVKCMERFMKFMSKNAFIMTAITGDKGFLGAGKAAILLITSNAANLTAVSGVSFFLLFLGKLFVVGVTSLVCALILLQDPSINFWTFPLLLIMFISYFIAEAFMGLYQMTIDTMFMCLMWDMKLAARGDEEYQGKTVWLSDRLDDYVQDQQSKPKDKNGGFCC